MTTRLECLYRSIGGPSGSACIEIVPIGHRNPMNVDYLEVRYDIGPRTSFGWGRDSLAAKQTAVALLSHCLGDNTAKAYGWDFVLDVVRHFDPFGFTIFSWQIESWVARRQETAKG